VQALLLGANASEMDYTHLSGWSRGQRELVAMKTIKSFSKVDINSASFELQSPLLLTQETGSVHDETSSSGNKEDEDDDEDEGEDKIDPQQYDPERLKAFNVSNS